jgi:hypothetical protein
MASRTDTNLNTLEDNQEPLAEVLTISQNLGCIDFFLLSRMRDLSVAYQVCGLTRITLTEPLGAEEADLS